MLTQTLQPMLELGPCLREILKGKGVSASELARMMAYKSRNSIFRILDGEGGYGARQAFYDRLTREDPLGLSDEERARLAQALEVSRVGPDNFMSNRAMRALLMNVSLKTAAGSVRVDAHASHPHDPDYTGAIAAMARGKKAYLTITGCCDRAIFDALRERIYRTDVSCEVKITHMVYTGAEEIVHNISAIQPLLYCDFYSAYCLEPGMFSRERESIYRCNCIYAHVQDEHGVWYDQQMMLVDKGVFVPLRRIESGERDPFEAFFERDLEKTPPLKAMFGKSSCIEDYVSYTEGCRRLEQSRAVYTIKLDIPVSFAPPEIAIAAVREGGYPDKAGLEKVIAPMERIHRQRYENFFTKKKVNHTIFSREAMEQFARTGFQSDHFFALRGYTPGERVQILENLRRQEAENPYFHIHFFRDDFAPPLTEVALYEGAGTLLAKPYTNYDLSGDHAEAIITQDEFCRKYKEFFIHDLLERHVISREQTLEVLDQLIEIAKNA